jgi:hypothetical protein
LEDRIVPPLVMSLPAAEAPPLPQQPFAVGITTVLTSQPLSEPRTNSSDAYGGRPPWVVAITSRAPVEELVQQGDDVWWTGQLEADPAAEAAMQRRMGQRRVLCRLVLLAVTLGCLAAALVGTILKGELAPLQVMYIACISTLILATCAFPSFFLFVCWRYVVESMERHNAVRTQTWTPVSVAAFVGHEAALPYLTACARCCFHCRRMTTEEESDSVRRARLLSMGQTRTVVLCDACLKEYQEGGKAVPTTPRGPTCAICLEGLPELRSCDATCPNGHLFHPVCMEEWKRTAKQQCPLCRADLLRM